MIWPEMVVREARRRLEAAKWPQMMGRCFQIARNSTKQKKRKKNTKRNSSSLPPASQSWRNITQSIHHAVWASMPTSVLVPYLTKEAVVVSYASNIPQHDIGNDLGPHIWPRADLSRSFCYFKQPFWYLPQPVMASCLVARFVAGMVEGSRWGRQWLADVDLLKEWIWEPEIGNPKECDKNISQIGAVDFGPELILLGSIPRIPYIHHRLGCGMAYVFPFLVSGSYWITSEPKKYMFFPRATQPLSMGLVVLILILGVFLH